MTAVRKIILRILMHIIPLFVFSEILDFIMFFIGAEFFDITFSLPSYVAFILAWPFIMTFPENIILLIFVSAVVKGENSKKIILIEYLIYCLLHVIIYLHAVFEYKKYM